MILYEDPKIAVMRSNLKKSRTIKGFTQEALAELSGVNIKSIAAYEQNPYKLNAASASTVKRLAIALGVEMEDIMEDEGGI